MNQLLIGIGGVLFFMILTGAILPSLISTDKIPMLLILFLIASIAFTIGAVILMAIRKFNPPKKGRKKK